MSRLHQKVFMIGWEYPPHNSGGLGVACQGLTQALADQQTQIYFTLPYSLSQHPSHLQLIECVDPSWVGDDSSPPFFAYASEVAGLVGQGQTKSPPSFDSHQLAALPGSELEHKVDQYASIVTQKSKRRQKNFNIIHAHDWMSFPAAAKIKNQTGKPMVAHVHSTEFDRIPSGHGSDFIMKTEYEGLAAADKIIAVSYFTKRLLIDKYSVDPDKIEVVHNGIDPLKPSSPQLTVRPLAERFASKRPVVVFMGRLTEQKGVHLFLELASLVSRQMPNVLFVVAGDGDLYHELLLSTAGRQLSAQVLFSGFVRDVQKEKLLNRADIFVMPSLSEPFGLVALEAAQRHTPVIVSKTSGVSEVLPSALAVDFWDTQKMAQTIQELLANQELRQGVVQRQRAEVDLVTWASAAQKVQNVYRRAFLGK